MEKNQVCILPFLYERHPQSNQAVSKWKPSFIGFQKINVEGMTELENTHFVIVNEIINLKIDEWLLKPLDKRLMGNFIMDKSGYKTWTQ